MTMVEFILGLFYLWFFLWMPWAIGAVLILLFCLLVEKVCKRS